MEDLIGQLLTEDLKKELAGKHNVIRYFYSDAESIIENEHVPGRINVYIDSETGKIINVTKS